MHPELNLLHHGPVHQGVRVMKRQPTVHGVILLGAVQEQGTANASPHHGEGPARALPARSGPTLSRPACLTPAYLVTNIFALTGDIGNQGQGRRRTGRCRQTQEPEGRQRWGEESRGETQGKRRRDRRQCRGIKGGVGGNIDDGVGREREGQTYRGSTGGKPRRRHRGEVPCRQDGHRTEAIQNRKVEWRGDGVVGV